jgi:hypothetical protein
MLWLYWRRVRLAAGAAGIALVAVAAVIALAFSLGGSSVGQNSVRGPGGMPPTGRRYPVPRAERGHLRHGQFLMSAAALACQSVSYHGVQMVAWSGSRGSDAYLIEVWHRSGHPELADPDEDEPAARSASGNAAIGVLSITPRMLGLLRANYLMEYTGTGTSSSRPALIVAIRRRDGSLAARYWLDQLTGLPLRREIFDSRGHLVSEGAFIDLQIGDRDVGLVPPPKTHAWLAQPTAASLVTLRRHGWTLPALLAGNLTLVGMTRAASGSGPIVDASYSDGLSVVSVFVQRGRLPDALPGWRRATVSGDQVYLTQPTRLGERGLAWSAGGFVYTVIADAPQETVARVVAQLPHDRHIGIWERIGHGLQRIGSWFNPLG